MIAFKRRRYCLSLGFILGLGMMILASCSEKEDVWDPYYNWQARNTKWFLEIADSARIAIAQAKAAYGDEWEYHCDWRMYKSLMRSADYVGPVTDSICVHILKHGTGIVSPAYTDSIRLNFRGWILETEYENDKGTRDSYQAVFSQTYYGTFNPLTAAPQTMAVSGTVEGFGTALQYMVKGDDWLVYIPENLAYGEKDSEAIPPYSTLVFRLNMVEIYESGAGLPTWQ